MKIEIGALSGVSADALEFCIGEVAKQAGLAEPGIEISTVSAQFVCSCGQTYSSADPLDGCPSCGGFDREITSGMDVLIREIVLENGAL